MLRTILRQHSEQDHRLKLFRALASQHGGHGHKYKDRKHLFAAESKERKRRWVDKMRATEKYSRHSRNRSADSYMALADEETDRSGEDSFVQNVHMTKHMNRQRINDEFRKDLLSKRYKTIKHKFFKDPQEQNLLTWDAKEQIKYLHTEFPDEWTVERLVESFPISENGVRKLLKSKFRPRSMEDLIKHDLRVKENWKLIGDAEKGEGPLLLRYSEMLRQGKLQQLYSAVGNTSLPMPKIELETVKPMSQLQKPGVFSNMIKSYVELQKKKEIDEKIKNKELQKEMYEKLKETNLKSLQNFIKTLPRKHIEQESVKRAKQVKSEVRSPITGSSNAVDYRKAFWYQDQNFDLGDETRDVAKMKVDENTSMFDMLNKMDGQQADDKEHDFSDEEIDDDALVFEHWKNQSKENLEKALSNQSKAEFDKSKHAQKNTTNVKHMTQSYSNNSDVAEYSFEDLGLKNTHILHPTKSTSLESNFEELNMDYFHTRPQKFTDNPIYDSISVEHASSVKDDTASYYVYSEETGYQYPYGKVHKQFDNIKIPRETDAKFDKTVEMKERIYKRGRDYFDKDGEFLYRVPE